MDNGVPPETGKRGGLDHQHIRLGPQRPGQALLRRVEVFGLEVGVGHQHEAIFFPHLSQIVDVGVTEATGQRAQRLELRRPFGAPRRAARQGALRLVKRAHRQVEPSRVQEGGVNRGVAVPHAAPQCVRSPGPSGRTKCTQRAHRGPPIGVARQVRLRHTRDQIQRRRRRGHGVPLGVHTRLPIHVPSLTADHRRDAPHVQVLALGDAVVLAKTPLDARFLHGLVTRHGLPHCTADALNEVRGEEGAFLGSITPLCPLLHTPRHIVEDVKTRHVGRRAVLHIHIDVAPRHLGPKPLLDIPLVIACRRLNVGVRVGDQRVSTFDAFHQPRNTSPRAVAVGAPRAHSQFPKRATRHAGQRPPFRRLDTHMAVAGPPPVDGGTLAQDFSFHLETAWTESRLARHEMHHPSQGIASVKHTAGPHDHLGLGHGKRIHGTRILEVS